MSKPVYEDDIPWREKRQESADRRARNKESSTRILTEKGIQFKSFNNGNHLVIRHNDKHVNFWPGTGLWIIVDTKAQRRGVFNLVKYLEESAQ